jgi:hypothetical protein
MLAISLLAACGKNKDAPTNNPGEGLHPNDYQFSESWPENKFTDQLPKPDFQIAVAEPGETVYSVVCEASVDQLKAYVESLKKAGFTINENTTEENAFSVSAYSYTASNEAGYTVEVNYSNMLGNLATVTIKNPIQTSEITSATTSNETPAS